MSIQDFYQKLVSTTENNALVETLRRLSLLDDPKAMFEGDPNADWIIWNDGSNVLGAAQA